MKAENNNGDFEDLAEGAAQGSTSPLREFSYLLARTRKYWMLPIILGLLAVGVVVVASGTVIAPIIYTLF
jgi:hypothetical protein